MDICYMVADLKYNPDDGVKICEIQQATLSLFNGDSFRNPEEESIHNELLRVLSLYNKKGWIVDEGIADKKLVATLANSSSWSNPKDLISLFSDQQFKTLSAQVPEDIQDIASYPGMLYISWSLLSVIYDFEERLPGMVIVDKSSFPFWVDKYRMTQLFAEDETLSSFKPKWGSYKKEYSASLADQIANDLGCSRFVIKPRGNFMGRGVIIAEKRELDDILKFIITKEGELAHRKDSAYAAWKTDTFDTFVVEEFIASETIQLPHVENKTYQPTMRVAFLLVYNNGHHEVHFLGDYWKTPKVSLDEEGDFMSKNKDICEAPYYLEVDEDIKKSVHDKLRVALPILHSKMLSYRAPSDEDYFEPVRRGRASISLEEVTPDKN